MPKWIKTTTEDGKPVITMDSPVSENRAKREGGDFLRKKCGECTFNNKGSYGFFDGEGSAGAREKQPYKICPGIHSPEAKC